MLRATAGQAGMYSVMQGMPNINCVGADESIIAINAYPMVANGDIVYLFIMYFCVKFFS